MQIDMTALVVGDQGYLSPEHQDGAAVAAAAYTGAELQLSGVTSVASPPAVGADPTGEVAIKRPGSFASASRFAMSASRAEVEAVVRAMFAQYSYVPNAVSKWTGKRGFQQVRLAAGMLLERKPVLSVQP
jgi:hypothetical protein